MKYEVVLVSRVMEEVDVIEEGKSIEQIKKEAFRKAIEQHTRYILECVKKFNTTGNGYSYDRIERSPNERPVRSSI